MFRNFYAGFFSSGFKTIETVSKILLDDTKAMRLYSASGTGGCSTLVHFLRIPIRSFNKISPTPSGAG
jgi:hypothetical protein